MPLTQTFRHLLIPLQMAPLMVIATFSVLLGIAAQARMLGLPLALIVVSWFFKYSFVLLDSVIEGRRDPPALSPEMANPVEQRPFGMLLLMIAFYVATMPLERYIGTHAVTAIRVVALSLVPAMVASMSITGRFMDALNPVDVFGLIARIPLAYFGMLAIIGALWLVPALLFSLTGAASLLPNLVLVAIAMYLWLAMLACVGGIIYDHREELGYEPNESPERAAARANAELDRDRDKVMDTIFAEYRGHAFANAGASVRKIMDGSRTPLVEFRWLYARAARWADPRMAEYLVQYCLPKLLQARASGEALDLVRERLRANETFRPLAAAHVLQMATLARDGGDKPTARRLLSDFDQRFPNDPAAPLAAKLSAEIAR